MFDYMFYDPRDRPLYRAELTTQSNTVVLEKLLVLQLFMKFPAFYGNRSFITAFTRAHQLSLS
jgi:hypothetical protein